MLSSQMPQQLECMVLMLLVWVFCAIEASPSRCGHQCMQTAVALRKQQVKRDLLERLGLSEPPTVNASAELPHLFNESLPFGLAGFQSEQADEEEREAHAHAKTQMIVSFAKPGIVDSVTGDLISMFNISARDYNLHVTSATLRMFVQPAPNAAHNDTPVLLTLNVYDVDKNGLVNNRPLASMKFVHKLNKGQWKELNSDEHERLSQLLNEHFSQQRRLTGQRRAYGLYAECTYGGRNLVKVPDNAGNQNAMHLSLKVSTSPLRRSKRSAAVQLDCQTDDQERRCCRSPMRIDFAEFGWDWIIAPKFYDAFICVGSCDDSYLTSVHGFLTTGTEVANPAVASPCCHPTDYSDLKIMYMTTASVYQVAQVPNMIAQRCGCA